VQFLNERRQHCSQVVFTISGFEPPYWPIDVWVLDFFYFCHLVAYHIQEVTKEFPLNTIGYEIAAKTVTWGTSTSP